MNLRLLRFILLVTLAVMLGITTLCWARSYSSADRIHGRLWRRASFLIASKQGRLVASPGGDPKWWNWEFRSYSVDDELSFPVGPIHQYESTLGIGWIKNPFYSAMRSTQILPDGTKVRVLGAATETFQGHAVQISHWLVALALASAFGLVYARGRISLRVLFLWLTVTALAFGLAASNEQRKKLNRVVTMHRRKADAAILRPPQNKVMNASRV